MNKYFICLTSLITVLNHALACESHNVNQHADLEKKVILLEKKMKILEDEKNNGIISKDNIKLTLKPSPEFETIDGRYKFAISGYAQMDAAFINKRSKESIFKLNEARIGVNGLIDKDWAYKVDFSPVNKKMKNAFISYKGFNNSYIKVGYFSPTFGLDESSSSTALTFMHDVLNSYIGPAGKHSIEAATNGKNWSITMGMSAQKYDDDKKEKYITTRLTYAPIYQDAKLIHLGFSGSRSFAHGNKFDGYIIPPHTDIYKDIYPELAIKTGKFDKVKRINIANLEFGAAYNQFSMQAEYTINKIMQAKEKPKLRSGYISLAWTLTGENRPYDPVSGSFDKISPAKPFNLEQNQYGAWEVAARYNFTTFKRNSDVNKDIMRNKEIALNWYPNDYIKFTADYLMVSRKDVSQKKHRANIFMLRSQVKF